jgi:hypothetical protein
MLPTEAEQNYINETNVNNIQNLMKLNKLKKNKEESERKREERMEIFFITSLKLKIKKFLRMKKNAYFNYYGIGLKLAHKHCDINYISSQLNQFDLFKSLFLSPQQILTLSFAQKLNKKNLNFLREFNIQKCFDTRNLKNKISSNLFLNSLKLTKENEKIELLINHFSNILIEKEYLCDYDLVLYENLPSSIKDIIEIKVLSRKVKN